MLNEEFNSSRGHFEFFSNRASIFADALSATMTSKRKHGKGTVFASLQAV